MDPRVTSLARTASDVAHLVAEASDADLDRQPPSGAWSARTALAYLRESESSLWRLRLEQLVTGGSPELAGENRAAWEHRTRHLPPQGKRRLLAAFALQRQANLSRLEELPDEAWAREATLPDGPAITLDALLDRWLAADRDLIETIERALDTTLDEVLRQRFAHRG